MKKFTIEITDDQRKSLETLAKEAGVPVNEFVKTSLLRCIREHMKEEIENEKNAAKE